MFHTAWHTNGSRMRASISGLISVTHDLRNTARTVVLQLSATLIGCHAACLCRGMTDTLNRSIADVVFVCICTYVR